MSLQYRTDIVFVQLHPFQETGWIPSHIIAKDENENTLGVVPLYLKRFSICYALYMQALIYLLNMYRRY